MSLPDHYLRARTKAGREEVKRREGIRHNVIGELMQINDALEFVEKVDDLNVNQTKITIAKQRTTLEMIIKQLSEAQLPYDSFGESYSEGQKNINARKKSDERYRNKKVFNEKRRQDDQRRRDNQEKRVALPDRC